MRFCNFCRKTLPVKDVRFLTICNHSCCIECKDELEQRMHDNNTAYPCQAISCPNTEHITSLTNINTQKIINMSLMIVIKRVKQRAKRSTLYLVQDEAENRPKEQKEDLIVDQEKKQLGLREGPNQLHFENGDNIGNRKRVPFETNTTADHISKILAGLNPDLPNQELRNLKLLDEVEPEEIDDLLESTVKPVFSACGKYYASFNRGSVEIRDASSNLISPIVRIELREKPYKGFTATPISTNIKFSPDSCFFAVLKVNTVLIYSIQGVLRMSISDYFVENNIKKSVMDKPFRRDIRDFFWSQNQALPQIIVQFKQANFFRVYTIDSEDVFHINYVIDGMQKNYAFGRGSNSKLMAVACKADQKQQKCMEICLFQTSDIQWKFVSFYLIPTVYIDKVELTQKNQFLLFSPPSRLSVHIYNFLSRQFKTLIQDPFLLLSDYKISDSGKYLAIATNSGNIFVYDTYSWVKIFEFQMDSNVNLENNLIVHNEQDEGFRVETKGIFKLPYISQTEENFDQGFIPLFNSITKIQFSPNHQFIAVKSIEMPDCVFIYGLRNVLTIIIKARNKVMDFKWLKVNEADQTLCIALEKNGVALWKNTCLAGSIVQQSIPDNPSGEIKVTDIEVSKQGSLILYAKEQKKFTYCFFDPSPQFQQEQENQI